METIREDDAENLEELTRSTYSALSSIESSCAIQLENSVNHNDNLVIRAIDTKETKAIKRCNKVVKWYYAAIKSLGWAPVRQNKRDCQYLICRGIIITIWLVLLFATFSLEILSCFSRNKIIFGTEVKDSDNTTHREISCHAHLFSKFFLDDILIVTIYLYGIYLFSFGETEYMYKITEKMFTKGNVEKQNWIIATIVGFFGIGLLWVLMSFVIRIMIAKCTHLLHTETYIRWNNTMFSDGTMDMIVIMMIFLFTTYDVIYYICTVNYVVQSEMIISYIRSVAEMIRNKTHSSLESVQNVRSTILIKDFGDIREKIHMLNGKAATATSIVIFIMTINTILAFISLDNAHHQSREISLLTVTASMNVILWLFHILIPFIQAARVSHEGKKLKEVGFYLFTAPFEYRNTDQKELDSFLAGAQAAKLRATLFGIPMYPSVVYAVLVIFGIVTLMTIQEDVYKLPNTI